MFTVFSHPIQYNNVKLTTKASPCLLVPLTGEKNHLRKGATFISSTS